MSDFFYRIERDNGDIAFQSDDRDQICDWLMITQSCDDYRVHYGRYSVGVLSIIAAPRFLDIVKGANWYAVAAPVTRAEFDALSERLAAVERALECMEGDGR